jgi:hypothetical protein
MVPPPVCGRGWGAHRARLRCPDDVSDDMYKSGVPGGALNLNSTGYLDQRFSNCGPRTTSGPRALPLWSS